MKSDYINPNMKFGGTKRISDFTPEKQAEWAKLTGYDKELEKQREKQSVTLAPQRKFYLSTNNLRGE